MKYNVLVCPVHRQKRSSTKTKDLLHSLGKESMWRTFGNDCILFKYESR